MKPRTYRYALPLVLLMLVLAIVPIRQLPMASATTKDIQSTLQRLSSIAPAWGTPKFQVTVQDLRADERWSIDGNTAMGYWSSFKWWAVAFTSSKIGYENINASLLDKIFIQSDNYATRDVVEAGGGLDALNAWTSEVVGMSASTCETTWYGLLPEIPCPSGRNTSSSNDAVKFLSRLYHGDLLDAADTAHVLDAGFLAPDDGEFHDREPSDVRHTLRHKPGYMPFEPWLGTSTIGIYVLPSATYAVAISVAQSTAGMDVQSDFTSYVACEVYRVMADPNWNCNKLAPVNTEAAALLWPTADPASLVHDSFGAAPQWLRVQGSAVAAVDVRNHYSLAATVDITLPCLTQRIVLPPGQYRRVSCNLTPGPQWVPVNWAMSSVGSDGLILGSQRGSFWLLGDVLLPELGVSVADGDDGAFGPVSQTPPGTNAVYQFTLDNRRSTVDSTWDLRISDAACAAAVSGQGTWAGRFVTVAAGSIQEMRCSTTSTSTVHVTANAASPGFAEVSLAGSANSTTGGPAAVASAGAA